MRKTLHLRPSLCVHKALTTICIKMSERETEGETETDRDLDWDCESACVCAHTRARPSPRYIHVVKCHEMRLPFVLEKKIDIDIGRNTPFLMGTVL